MGRPEPPTPGRWPTPGVTLAGRYRLVERIGAGGMSVIWRALDVELDRLVAVKLPGPDRDVPVDRDALARTEARTMAAVSHPDVVVVHDVGQVTAPDGTTVTFLVLQMLAGESLLDVLASGALGWRQAVRIAARLAAVLAAVHAHGVVHRDVTPDNVMVADGEVKLLDFGIAARIGDRPQRSWTFGTPPYLAPERLADAPADPAADVYSLGALLVEMLTGRPPDDAIRMPAAVPAEVVRLCDRCLGREPGRRPSAAEVAAELDSLTDPMSGGHQPPQTLASAAAPAGRVVTAVLEPAADRRGRGPVIAGVATVVAGALAAAVTIVALTRSPTPPPPEAQLPAPELSWSPLIRSTRPTTTPGPSRSNKPTRVPSATRTSAPSTGGPASATTGASASPTVSLAVAAAQLRELLRRDLAEGTVSSGAAQKIDAQAVNVVNNQHARADNLAQLMSDLRRSLADEIRDGGVSAAAAPALSDAVDRVGDAVTRSTSAG
ncbi:protein kinase [Micromonospora sp. WMMA1998]|uniref:serine/threonine-protein kinase n=1 Tax=Micromonospora sp. WMMA1998 TaxID=3015167 RepID=UPI00248D2A26|nr:serine/threonine protein kinase [Micromonospora sp. WMMA1998]WBC16705.1 protein kinase [Micromonospora sp. WMMA1998]